MQPAQQALALSTQCERALLGACERALLGACERVLLEAGDRLGERERRRVAADEGGVAPVMWPARPVIVYEDADLIVVDKPAGMVVHPACGHRGDTLLDAMAAYTPSVPSPEATPRPRLVHRLDKDTSGLLVLARTRSAHRYLSYQWQRRTVVKCYLALVQGHLEPPDGVIALPLARDPQDRRRVVATPAGQAASTRYVTLERYAGYTLLDVQPETGRLHQIRVHLAACGHAIAGDGWYGVGTAPGGSGRLFLHARRLVVRLPATRVQRAFDAALSPDLACALADLRAGAITTGSKTRPALDRLLSVHDHAPERWPSLNGR